MEGHLTARTTQNALSQRRFAVTYEGLGVRPFINCVGTESLYGGFVIAPEIREVMDYASRYCVPIVELQEAVGRRIAEMTGAEAAFVTSGACGAMQAGTAACVAGDDPSKIQQLPDCTGLKNEVLVLKSHRVNYDHAVKSVGVRLIEVESAEELEAAINERTAMIFAVGCRFGLGAVSVEEMGRIGKKKKIPLFCDAAAEFLENPNPYLEAGFDLVTHSVGKPLWGPQGTGILIGSKELIRRARLNTSPHPSLGRASKVSKEEIMATLACVDLWFNGRNHEAEFKRWNQYAQTIMEKVRKIPSVATTLEPFDAFRVSPFLIINWCQSKVKITPDQVSEQLFQGDPRIRMVTAASGIELAPLRLRVGDGGRGLDGMIVRPYVLQEGEAETVANRLNQILLSRSV